MVTGLSTRERFTVSFLKRPGAVNISNEGSSYICLDYAYGPGFVLHGNIWVDASGCGWLLIGECFHEEVTYPVTDSNSDLFKNK